MWTCTTQSNKTGRRDSERQQSFPEQWHSKYRLLKVFSCPVFLCH